MLDGLACTSVCVRDVCADTYVVFDIVWHGVDIFSGEFAAALDWLWRHGMAFNEAAIFLRDCPKIGWDFGSLTPRGTYNNIGGGGWTW